MKKSILFLSLALITSYSNLYAQSTDPGVYCDASFDDMDGTFPVADHIKSVSMGTLTNASNGQFAAPHYVLYNNLAVPNFNIGGTYTCTIIMEVHGGAGFGVWIDYNHNNTFESSEKISGSTSASDWLAISTNTTKTKSVTIPNTALQGQTRMRVRIVEDDTYTASANGTLISPCNASTSVTDVMDWGETEDYVVNIVQATDAQDLPALENIAVYPNPASNSLWIDRGAASNLSYKIFDITGQLVKAGSLCNAEKHISIESLSDGSYFLQLMENGVAVGNSKFTKAGN